ncbi:hypothetical protein Ciccas_006258 [Cichlidogyrus casuarinus]|uniref:CNNM transmembrane domain-containing protein n=1 Tax=Cichlidogyrus casuarinus TaxID=1844966 RepID=A0ABD2Q6A1_9PLAT
MSGLTLGLLSIDKIRLEIIAKDKNSSKQRYLRKLYRVMKNQHLLLTTLLIANAVCVEAMPIFLDKISNPVTAIIISVCGVLIFGELIYLCIALFFPVAWPLSKLMDWFLGTAAPLYNREQLKILLKLHSGSGDETEIFSYGSTMELDAHKSINASKIKSSKKKIEVEPVLSEFEMRFLTNSLTLGSTTAESKMQSLSKLPLLSLSGQLDTHVIKTMALNHQKQMPVLNPDRNFGQISSVKCLLKVDDLLYGVMLGDVRLKNDDDEYWTVEDMLSAHPELFVKPQFVRCDCPFFEVLKRFADNPELDLIFVTDITNYHNLDVIGGIHRELFTSSLIPN